MKLTNKQREARIIMANNRESLLVGGSRSGKTFLAVRQIFVRAIRCPNSNHLICRRHFNHVKASIWNQTMPKVLEICFPDLALNYDKVDWIVTLPNGARIWFAGLDDKERMEKVLGTEYSTIYMNEASQTNWDHHEMLITRLSENLLLDRRFYVDCNPPYKRHWLYQYFIQRKKPEDKSKMPDDYPLGYIYMNPKDNEENLTEDYISSLYNLSVSKRKRFLHGEFGDDSDNALFRSTWIYDNRIDELPDLDMIIVGFDPATTAEASSDEHGIVICGMKKEGNDRHFYIIDDVSFRGSVNDAATKCVETYHKYKADKVVVETNNGGDWIPNTINRIDYRVKVEKVTATRGKAKRADPISALYERGLVHHLDVFEELEDQMITWTPESNDSPDRLDAMVWGMTWLSFGADYKYESGLSLAGIGGI